MLLKADAASVSIYIEIKSPMLIVRYVLMQCDLVCMLLHLLCLCVYVCMCVFGTHYRLSMPASFLSSLMSISIYLESKLHICCYGVFRNEFISFTNECMHPLLHVQCTIYTDSLSLTTGATRVYDFSNI